MDPSNNRRAALEWPQSRKEEAEAAIPDERPHYVGVCERGVWSQRGCQEVSVGAELIGLSASPCLLALPSPISLATLFCCVGRLGQSCRGRVKDSDSRGKLGGGGEEGCRPLTGPGFWITDKLKKKERRKDSDRQTEAGLCRGGSSQWDGLRAPSEKSQS